MRKIDPDVYAEIGFMPWNQLAYEYQELRKRQATLQESLRNCEKLLKQAEFENEAWREGWLDVYQMPQGDWAHAFMGTIRDGYETKDDARLAALKDTDVEGEQ